MGEKMREDHGLLRKMSHNKGIDGKEIIDDLGRKLVLRKPNILDRYQLLKAMGQDANNSSLTMMMLPALYVAAIDDAPFPTPRTFVECEAGLKKLEEEGIRAIVAEINEYEESREKELKNNIKK
jgi:hypothetical protein